MLRRVGPYVVGEAFAAGGMATVHLGSLVAPGNFARIVAVKRLRPEIVEEEPALRPLLVHEARVASRLRHANIAGVMDLIDHQGELLLVTEYVNGLSLAELRADAPEPVPLSIVSAIASGLLHALAHAHQLADAGNACNLVHRDVSPTNVLVGADGVPRLIDFGIAVIATSARFTRTGEVRGKVGYLSPEQLAGDALDARSDVYSAAVVLWELLAGRALWDAKPGPDLLEQMTIGVVDRVRRFRPEVPLPVDEVLRQALSSDRERRPASALDMARRMEASLPPASPTEVAQWVATVGRARLQAREQRVTELEAQVLADREGEDDEKTTRGVDVPPVPPRSRRGEIAVLALAAGAMALATSLLAVTRLKAPVAASEPVLLDVAPPQPSSAAPTAVSTAAPLASTWPVSTAPSLDEGEPPGPTARPAPSRVDRPRHYPRTCETTYDLAANGHKTYKRTCF